MVHSYNEILYGLLKLYRNSSHRQEDIHNILLNRKAGNTCKGGKSETTYKCDNNSYLNGRIYRYNFYFSLISIFSLSDDKRALLK